MRGCTCVHICVCGMGLAWAECTCVRVCACVIDGMASPDDAGEQAGDSRERVCVCVCVKRDSKGWRELVMPKHER